MKKLISYVLFGNEPRYWGNIPYIIAATSVIYPDFYMRFYIHEDSISHPYYQLLKEISEINDKLEIELISDSYTGTQLTAWRMKPLWDEDIEFLICRDLDYALSILERTSVEYFMTQSNCLVHGIRSYHTHTTPYMAGLCGFRVKKVLEMMKQHISTFEEYISWGENNVSYCKEWIWGCDQALLRNCLYMVGLYPFSLDCPQYTAPLTIHDFPAELVTSDKYINIPLSNCDREVLQYSDNISPTFAGQAWNCKTDDFYKICELVNNETSKILRDYFI
jgi:hypothetical protein